MEPLITKNFQSYLNRTINLQEGSGKTFKSRRSDIITTLIFSIVAILLFLVLINFIKSSGGLPVGSVNFITGPLLLIFIIICIASFFTFFASFIMLYHYYSKPQKTIICPFCKNSHKIYTDVNSYVCDKCNNIICLSKSKIDESSHDQQSSDLNIANCPICNTKWATTENFGLGQCFCCGVKYTIHKNQIAIVKDYFDCPKCNNKLPLAGCPKSNFNQPKKSKYQQKNQLTFNYSSKNEPFP